MLPQKTRHLLYAVLLAIISTCGSTVLAKTAVKNMLTDKVSTVSKDNAEETGVIDAAKAPTVQRGPSPVESGSMFATIVQGADQEVTCPNDGSTLAKFFLCGTSDTRTLSLSQSGSTYQWQQLDPNTCAPTVVDNCPTINSACTW